MTPKADPKARRSFGLLDLATGKTMPWLDDPVESFIGNGNFLASGKWLVVGIERWDGGISKPRRFLVPWQVPAPPRSEWIEFSAPRLLKASESAPFIYYFDGPRFMALHFDPKTRRVSEPFAVRFPPGHESDLSPEDDLSLREPGIVVGRREYAGSVWLMKLPEQ